MSRRLSFARGLVRHASALARSRRGSSSVEYVLVATLVAIASIAAFADLGNRTLAFWDSVNTQVDGASRPRD